MFAGSGRLSGETENSPITVNLRLSRALTYAALSLSVLTVSILEVIPLVLFAMIAIASSVLREGRIFRLLADPAERRTGKLVGLTEFSSIATVLSAGMVLGILPSQIFVGVVLLMGVGALGAELARSARSDRLTETIGFITLGFVAYSAGHTIGAEPLEIDFAVVGFLAMAGALGGALARSAIWARHDGIVMLVLTVYLGGLYTLPAPSMQTVALAILTSILLAYLALLIGAASVPGLVTGVLLVFLTIVLGGTVWVAILVAFFVIGGLATKYRYDEKQLRGVAEPNRGTRGTGNVLGNTAIALVAVLGYAAITESSFWDSIFLFAFAGSLATALSDTLSSEIGGLYDKPMLITSFDRVAPGTDGAITVQGLFAGLAGSIVIGVLFTWLGPATLSGGIVIVLAGFVGMNVDSLLGAMVEGRIVGNHLVNASATLSGALVASVFPALGFV